jgi:hypothetical protein
MVMRFAADPKVFPSFEASGNRTQLLAVCLPEEAIIGLDSLKNTQNVAPPMERRCYVDDNEDKTTQQTSTVKTGSKM